MHLARLRLPLRVSILSALLFAGCAITHRPATLKLDSRLLGGTEATASIQVPSNWHQQVRKSDRAVFIGPDNFSRIYFTSLESLTPATECDALLRRSIESFKAEHSRGLPVELELTPAGGLPQLAYDFRMNVPGNPPGPTDRVFTGRALCGDGGIGLVACAVGKNRVGTLGKTCDEVVSSLTLEQAAPAAIAAPAQPEPAPAPEPQGNETINDPTPSGSQPIDQPQADPMPSQSPEEADPSQTDAPEAPEQE